MDAVKLAKAQNHALDRASISRVLDEAYRLRTLGYASESEEDREAAGKFDTWLAGHFPAIEMLRVMFEAKTTRVANGNLRSRE